MNFPNVGTPPERYRELIQKRDKKIVRLFEPHTQSRAAMQLIDMYQKRLVAGDELIAFSDDL